MQQFERRNAQDDQAKTGVTVLYFPQTAIAGVDISGGGPASRETPVLSPLTNPTPLNAIVLSGGSAYGLAAADGVMTTLEKHGIGYDTRCALVPIVCQSDIYDLSYGASNVRPDARMGAEAAENALAGTHPLSGNVGAGTGATVGKACGMKRAMKSGIGYSAAQLEDIRNFIAYQSRVGGFADVLSANGNVRIESEFLGTTQATASTVSCSTGHWACRSSC